MTFIRNLRIATKLPLLMALVTLGCLSVAAFVAYEVSRATLTAEIKERLELVAEGRATLIESWAEGVQADVHANAYNPTTIQALREFSVAFGQISDRPEQQLQSLYIHNNPHPIGDRDLLDFARDGSSYSLKHAQYHPVFRSILIERGYYDLFLFNTDGDLIYSVFKGQDFATNMLNGAYAGSGLGEVFRAAADLPKGDAQAFVDFKPYAASQGAPAAFVGMPVFDQLDQLVGVLAVQLPIDRMQAIMGDHRGMTETSRTIVVAPDLTSRSEIGLSRPIEFMSKLPANDAISMALRGESGVTEVTSDAGEAFEVAFTPVEFMGTTWAMLSAEPLEVFLAGPRNLLVQISLATGIVLTIAIALCVLTAKSISSPLVNLARMVNKVAGGDYSSEIPSAIRRDELGGISRAIRDLQQDMSVFHAGAQENRYKSAAFADTSAAMMITDQDFNISYVNDAVMEILRENEETFSKAVPGFQVEKVLGANMDMFHKDPSHARRILGDPSNFPYNADISLGLKRFSLYVSAVSDDKGDVFGYVVEWQDVSEQRINESILKAIDTYQCTVQFFPDGKIDLINAQLSQVLGEGADKFTGQPVDHLFVFNPTLSAERGAVWDRLKAGSAVYGKFQINRSDGSEGWLEGGFSPVLDKRKQLVRVSFIGSDRTQIEAKLRQAEQDRAESEAAQALVVDQLRIALDRMSEGDLTTSIDSNFRSDYEQLRRDFNASVQRLHTSMSGVAVTSNAISDDVASIADAATDLSRRTERQAATLEQTAASLDELTASVRQAAAGAVEADRIVSGAREKAQASGEIVGETVSAMSKIEASSQQISKIISVIDDIAFQTNLLALNAGVEAARAGDAGRGFAVVASEVRALAQRSSEAASEINGLITESTRHVQHGVQLVDRTGNALAQIVTSVGEISEHMSQIANSAQEQSSGLAEINTAVNQLDQTTQQNAAMFEETTAASTALRREASSLSDNIGRFNLGTEVPQPDSDATNWSAKSQPPQARTFAAKANGTSPTAAVDDATGWEDF